MEAPALSPPVSTPLRRGNSSSTSAMMLGILWRRVRVALVMAALLALAFFPWATDAPLTAANQAELQKYYTTAYQQQNAATQPEADSKYVRIAEEAAARLNIKGAVEEFARRYSLADKKVLDIGAGRGYLQDVVENYTGLDISPSARRFFHKKFVHASATYMPFPDGEFDAAWTIWVLEHVPNPEAALSEMRRVLKHHGLLLLGPAWDCTPWAAQGYPVRPYSDFSLAGKLIKASIPIHSTLSFLSKVPIRLLRYGAWAAMRQPTKFHYRRLTPNYDQYWMPDSDAVNSLDHYEAALWFISRGDDCLNCETAMHGWMDDNFPLIIRINKQAPAQ